MTVIIHLYILIVRFIITIFMSIILIYISNIDIVSIVHNLLFLGTLY